MVSRLLIERNKLSEKSKFGKITRREFLESTVTGCLGLLGVLALGSSPFIITGCKSGLLKANKVKFVFIADGHWNLEGNWTHVMHELLIKSLNSLKDIDFIVFGGDNFNNNSPGYEDAGKYESVMKLIRYSKYYILGNKESTPSPKGDPLNKEDFKKMFFSPEAEIFGYNWKIEKGDYVFIGLDSSIDNSTPGKLDAKTVDFIESQLKGSPDKHHILMMHHLLKPLGKDDPEWLVKRNTIQNYESIIPRICKYKNLKLWLCAHQHEKKVWNEGHVRVISAPGFVVPPHSYMIIEMENGNIIKEKFVSLQNQAQTQAKATDAVSSASAKATKFKRFDLEFNDDGFNKKEIIIPLMAQVRIDLMNNSSKDSTLTAEDFGISLTVKKGQLKHFEFTAVKAGKYLYKSSEIASSGYFVVK